MTRLESPIYFHKIKGAEYLYIQPFMFFGLYILLLATALIIYLLKQRTLPKSFNYLAVLLVVVLTVELSKYFFKKYQLTFFVIDHLYQPLEFILISTVYRSTYQNSKNKKFVKNVIPVFVAIALLSSTFIDGWNQRNTVSFLIESFLLIVFAITYILELYNKPTYQNILTIPFFWINTGILFYCAGTFFQVGMHGYLKDTSPTLAEQLNIINQVLNVLLYSTFITGFLCKNPR